MMILVVILFLGTAIFTNLISDKLMHQQWYAKDSYYQKKMIDKAKVYKNISTLTLVGGAILSIYLLYKL